MVPLLPGSIKNRKTSNHRGVSACDYKRLYDLSVASCAALTRQAQRVDYSSIVTAPAQALAVARA